MDIQTLTYILTVCSAIVMMSVAAREISRDLMMFQQNSYRYARYTRWLSQSADTTSGFRLCSYALFLLSLAKFSLSTEWPVMTLYLIFGIVYLSRNAGVKYKKPLVWTPRATRIYSVCALLAMIAYAVAFCIFGINGFFAAAVISMGLYAASHILLMLANFLLTPVERHITRRYYNDAARRLKSMPGLKVIGITGSYGKTSTKHFLERIVSEKYQVTMTPGSFNTTLGVVRTVREHLKPYDEVFIVEMGAKNIGDIREICDLVHPQIGIITAVGEQHLESFKSIENVQAAKFELADALPADGLAILNDDFEYVANRAVENTPCIRYAVDRDDLQAQYRATDISCSRKGTDFTVSGPEGYSLRLHTRLLGSCNISNLLGAVIAARALGIDDARIVRAVTAIEPVEHRLSSRLTPGGITILDDAFNSNPDGSAMALDVLSMMTPGQRIVITPGMIELGERQYDLNKAFGEKIARCADVAIIVGQYNREAILDGIREAGLMPETAVHCADTFRDSQRILAEICRPGDTVLYENDLPDTFK